MRQRRLEAQQMQDGDQQVREVVRQRTIRDNRPAANVNERGRPVLEQRQDMRDSVANWRGNQRDLRQQRVEQRTERNRVRIPVGARPDRPAPAPETAARDNHYSHWRTDWRHDRRYDWRNYRHHHRSTFRLGIYIDPFGWGYHRYNIGWRMWPSFYSSNYWLNDPYMYRLPYAPWPFKWVRYYDDALLVNVMTGQVVDVMYDFFW
ncbi:MAG TPA: RcnB family protein [Sphingomicrobium sp.]|nr:RcnB family protein [Sphingomicrobium sp.]